MKVKLSMDLASGLCVRSVATVGGAVVAAVLWVTQ
jgi:hypothetical protein